MLKQFLASIAIIALALANCPANYKINNLVAGIILIYSDSVAFSANANASSSSQNYIYSFNQAFANTPVLGLGILHSI